MLINSKGSPILHFWSMEHFFQLLEVLIAFQTLDGAPTDATVGLFVLSAC